MIRPLIDFLRKLPAFHSRQNYFVLFSRTAMIRHIWTWVSACVLKFVCSYTFCLIRLELLMPWFLCGISWLTERLTSLPKDSVPWTYRLLSSVDWTDSRSVLASLLVLEYASSYVKAESHFFKMYIFSCVGSNNNRHVFKYVGPL